MKKWFVIFALLSSITTNCMLENADYGSKSSEILYKIQESAPIKETSFQVLQNQKMNECINSGLQGLSVFNNNSNINAYVQNGRLVYTFINYILNVPRFCQNQNKQELVEIQGLLTRPLKYDAKLETFFVEHDNKTGMAVGNKVKCSSRTVKAGNDYFSSFCNYQEFYAKKFGFCSNVMAKECHIIVNIQLQLNEKEVSSAETLVDHGIVKKNIY